MPKKFLGLFLSLVLMFSVAIPTFAATDVAAKGRVRIDAENFDECYDPTTTVVTMAGLDPRYVSFNRDEWMDYTLNVAVEGDYRLIVLGAIDPSSATASLTVSVNEKDVLNGTVGKTTGWTDFEEHDFGLIHLKKGTSVLRFYSHGSGFHFDYFILEREAADKMQVDFSRQSGAYRKAVLPTAIEAEDYDLGETGSFALTEKNKKKYRTDGQVQIDAVGSGYGISLEEGEWTRYTFEVEATDLYGVILCGYGADRVSLYFDDYPVPVEVKTGGNASYREIVGETILFEEGVHTVTVYGPVSFDYLRFAAASGDYISLTDLAQLPDSETETKDYSIWKTIYVSADGSDDGTGEKGSPFKTIERAKEEVAVLHDIMEGNIEVCILPGYYKLDETVVFSPEHAGRDEYRVIYRGSSLFDPPVISGGEAVSGWTQVTEQIWKAPAPEVDEIRNLYVDGRAATRARSRYCYLNEAFYDDPSTPYAADGVTVSVKNFPAELSNPEDIELVWNLEWAAQRTPVADMIRNEDSVIFLMEQPCFKVATELSDTDVIRVMENKRFYIENAPELLDSPGEFYYNKAEGMIYYYPFSAQNLETAECYVGDTEGLFEISGESVTDKLQNISFENLIFRYGAWNDVSRDGMVTIQLDQMVDTADAKSSLRKLIPAQLSFRWAENISIKNCDFGCLGSSAVALTDGIKKADVTGNAFHDISAMAVSVGTFRHETVTENTEMCSDINITNNAVRRIATEYRCSAAFGVYYEKNIKILHNDIRDVPYSGISAGWGWGTRDPNGWGHMDISYNRIENVMSSMKDGAHIYTLGNLHGSTISNNYLYKTGTWRGGVYTDSGSGNIDIFNNVIDIDKGYWWHISYNAANPGHDMKAYHNFSTRATHLQNGTNNTVTDLTVVTDCRRNDEANAIIEQSGLEPMYQRLLSKVEAPDWYFGPLDDVPTNAFIDKDRASWYEAEDFNRGGEGVGYHKITPLPNNNDYRDDEVGLRHETAWENYVIDRNFPGEWFKYDIEIAEEGIYDLQVSTGQAWPDDQPTPAVKVSVDDAVVFPALYIPKSTEWSSLEKFVIGSLELSAGYHTVTFEIVNNGFYFDAFRFVKQGLLEEWSENSNINDEDYDEGVLRFEKEPEIVYEFSDISGHWAEFSIQSMKEQGFINGVSETRFDTEGMLTREQAILLAMRCFYIAHDEEFWQTTALRTGLLNADRPVGEAITREEFADIMIKAYSVKHNTYKITLGTPAFADIDQVEGAYFNAVLGVKELKIMQGDENGYFRPQEHLTRAEAATVIARVVNDL